MKFTSERAGGNPILLRARVTPLESYPGNKRSGAEQLGHDEHSESKTSGRLALIAGRHTAGRGSRFAVTVIGRASGFISSP